MAGAEGEADCLRRELYEELGIHAMLGDVLHRTTHTYPNGRHVALSFIHVPAYHGRLVNKAFQDFVWETPARLLDYDFLEGDIPFVTHLARGTWRHIFSPLTTIRAKS